MYFAPLLVNCAITLPLNVSAFDCTIAPAIVAGAVDPEAGAVT
jgi:hypothetical protein